ncbi:PREDICTED: leucine-rich repeat-containing protein 52-like [Tinamus guttatus]|uniref:leucine-rich repeat-containing protein 52-like n=1 Tax=Tinamus guttatus TaxID=94827 RepID=UPI00052EC159|nr:PREDICTED: leucine-rich repeat-containing protein 52-like [Tinamus guttatus]
MLQVGGRVRGIVLAWLPIRREPKLSRLGHGLRRLFVVERPLPSFVWELSFLTDLAYLDCQKNCLGDDLDFTFISMSKLAYLDHSFNNLQCRSPWRRMPLPVTPWLGHLDMSQTGLLFLDTSTVSDLPNLRFLGLGDNRGLCLNILPLLPDKSQICALFLPSWSFS